jgi:hypothetical protein
MKPADRPPTRFGSKRAKRRTWLVRGLSALLAVTMASGAAAQARQQKWAAAYVEWSFDGVESGQAVAQDLWIPQPAVASFFTLNFDFVTGDGGYIGLQSDENGAGNVRFSLWNTTVARGDSCRPFDGEGEGMTCTTPVTIVRDGVYRVRVTRGDADSQGQWWIGWLQAPNGTQTRIGAIRTPPEHTAIAAAGMHDFSEFWGEAVAACRDAPLSAAAFAAPRLVTADNKLAIGTRPNGTRPSENRCLKGGERQGAAVTHQPLTMKGAAAMLITLGGAPAANQALARRLATEAPSR